MSAARYVRAALKAGFKNSFLLINQASRTHCSVPHALLLSIEIMGRKPAKPAKPDDPEQSRWIRIIECTWPISDLPWSTLR
jgi:hypothetical protein